MVPLLDINKIKNNVNNSAQTKHTNVKKTDGRIEFHNGPPSKTKKKKHALYFIYSEAALLRTVFLSTA